MSATGLQKWGLQTSFGVAAEKKRLLRPLAVSDTQRQQQQQRAFLIV